MVGLEHRLGPVVRARTYLVIAGVEVELGEIALTGQFIEKLVDHRHRKLVLHGNVVEAVVVDAEPSSFLTQSSEGAEGLGDEAGDEHLGDPTLDLVLPE